ncbi:MAG: single-stranded DNA-binding protein [Promicromonosporaceae bacterium]|nr:single-stranded DNA-binding protein [Promicromonosporaceae bacterium]
MSDQAEVNTEAAEDETSRKALLEEEGEVAADYLEELLDIADLDGDIDIDVRHGRAAIEIVSEDSASLEHLVGRGGEVLDALQGLTRLAVQTKTGERSRLMLDVGDFRARRRTELTEAAERVVAQVRETGTEKAMEPMNAFERKVVHDVIAAAGLISGSRGVDPNRYVVVKLTE